MSGTFTSQLLSLRSLQGHRGHVGTLARTAQTVLRACRPYIRSTRSNGVPHLRSHARLGRRRFRVNHVCVVVCIFGIHRQPSATRTPRSLTISPTRLTCSLRRDISSALPTFAAPQRSASWSRSERPSTSLIKARSVVAWSVSERDPSLVADRRLRWRCSAASAGSFSTSSIYHYLPNRSDESASNPISTLALPKTSAPSAIGSSSPDPSIWNGQSYAFFSGRVLPDPRPFRPLRSPSWPFPYPPLTAVRPQALQFPSGRSAKDLTGLTTGWPRARGAASNAAEHVLP